MHSKYSRVKRTSFHIFGGKSTNILCLAKEDVRITIFKFCYRIAFVENISDANTQVIILITIGQSPLKENEGILL